MTKTCMELTIEISEKMQLKIHLAATKTNVFDDTEKK